MINRLKRALAIGLLMMVCGIHNAAVQMTAQRASESAISVQETPDGISTTHEKNAPAASALPEFTPLTNFTDTNYNEHGYIVSMVEYGGFIYSVIRLQHSKSSAVAKRDLDMNLVWNKSYPIDGRDITIFNDVIFVIGNNYTTSKLLLFKIDLAGNLVSEFQSPSTEFHLGTSIDHNSTHIFITYWHKIDSYNHGGIACLTFDFNLVWSTYLSSAGGSTYFSQIRIHENEIYVCGKNTASGFENITIVKYSINGGFIWDFQEAYEEGMIRSLIISEDSIIGVGFVRQNNMRRGYVGKFTLSGGLIWSRLCGSNTTNSKAVTSVALNKYFIHSFLTDFTTDNTSIVTWSHDGDIILETPISQPSLNFAALNCIHVDNNFYVAGMNITMSRPAYQSILCTIPPPSAPGLQEIAPPLSVTGKIDLQWADQPAVDNYTVYRSTEPIAEPLTLEPIATITDLYYNDTLEINATYHYAVKAHNLYGSSPLSVVRQVVVDIPSGDPEPVFFPPDAPVLAINTESPTTEYNIALIWTGDSLNDNYTLYRLDEPISNNSLPSPAQLKATAVITTDKNEFMDTVGGPGKYYYAVIARNESGVSNLSNSEYIIVVEITEPISDSDPPEIAGAPIIEILISGMIIFPLIKRRKRLS